MRRRVLSCATLLPALLAVMSCRKEPARVVPENLAAQVNVAVNATCTNEGVTFSLSPWRARLRPGAPIRFVLDQNAGTNEIVIQKDQQRWPYLDLPPYTSRKGTPGGSNRMDAGVQPGNLYRYSVHLTCTSAGGVAHRVVIDPELIIVGINGEDFPPREMWEE